MGELVTRRASTASSATSCCFNMLLEAKVLIEQWRVHYNTAQSYSSLGYCPPAPEVIISMLLLPLTDPGSTGSIQYHSLVLH